MQRERDAIDDAALVYRRIGAHCICTQERGTPGDWLTAAACLVQSTKRRSAARRERCLLGATCCTFGFRLLSAPSSARLPDCAAPSNMRCVHVAPRVAVCREMKVKFDDMVTEADVRNYGHYLNVLTVRAHAKCTQTGGARMHVTRCCRTGGEAGCHQLARCARHARQSACLRAQI